MNSSIGIRALNRYLFKVMVAYFVVFKAWRKEEQSD